MSMFVAEIVWLVAIALLLGYEAWALFTNHPTLSRAVWQIQTSEYGTLLPFLVGLLCGHFFWSGKH